MSGLNGANSANNLRRWLAVARTRALLLCGSLLPHAAQALDNVTYYHQDALGSTIAATNETGVVTWRERYLSYGTRVRREDGGSNSLWYTGKSEESDFGLQYFGARWYDSQLGQFLAIDPVGYREQKTTSFNRYSYAVQNPYKYVDPDGKLEIWAQKNMVDGTYTYSVRLAKPVDKWQPVINIFGPWQYGVGDAISETVKGKPAGPKEGIDIERVIALDAKLGNYIESSENGLFEYSETEIDDAIQRFMTDGHNGDSGVSQKDVSEFFKIYGGDGTNLMKKARENYDNSGKNVHIPSVVAPALER